MDPIGLISRSSNWFVDSFHKSSIVIGDGSAFGDEGDNDSAGVVIVIFDVVDADADNDNDVGDGNDDRLSEVSCLYLLSDSDENVLDDELHENCLSMMIRCPCWRRYRR